MNNQGYDGSGWTFFEACASAMIKPPARVVEVGEDTREYAFGVLKGSTNLQWGWIHISGRFI
eukprot:5544250-Alexandrium_andersonii.AAC.1